MKPKRIILIRHGQSIGNLDWAHYEKIQGHNIPLSKSGHKQALDAGIELKKIIRNESVQFYVSPFVRTRQTYAEILKSFVSNKILTYEEPRLREQDMGHLRSKAEYTKNRNSMEEYSKFFFRFRDGESGADVYDRVSTFLETIHRDFKKLGFAENVIIVTHGTAMLLFLMRWFHWKVEEYENAKPIGNCDYIIMKKLKNNKYKISNQM